MVQQWHHMCPHVSANLLIPYLNGRIQEKKRGRRRPVGPKLGVACRTGPAAANLHRSGLQEVFRRSLLKGSGISASSAAVNRGPHAVPADAWHMPCSRGNSFIYSFPLPAALHDTSMMISTSARSICVLHAALDHNFKQDARCPMSLGCGIQN